MNKFIVFFALAAFTLSSCHPKKTPTPVSPALLAAYDFKEGSYWIYRDSVSGQYDSFRLWDYATNNYGYLSNRYFLTEYTEASPLQNDSILWLVNLSTNDFGINHDKGNFLTSVYDVLKYPFTSFEGSSYCVYPMKVCNVSGKQYDSTTMVIFKEYGQPDILYLKDGIGPVKICLNNPKDAIYSPKILELQRYKIVK